MGMCSVFPLSGSNLLEHFAVKYEMHCISSLSIIIFWLMMEKLSLFIHLLFCFWNALNGPVYLTAWNEHLIVKDSSVWLCTGFLWVFFVSIIFSEVCPPSFVWTGRTRLSNLRKNHLRPCNCGTCRHPYWQCWAADISNSKGSLSWTHGLLKKSNLWTYLILKVPLNYTFPSFF